MTKFLNLLKINLLGFFNFNKTNKHKRSWGMIILYVVIFLYLMGMMYFFTNSIIKVLISLNMGYIVLIFGMFLVSFQSILSTLLRVNKTLFNSNDYSILLSFPIKKSTIISSKLFTLYIMNFIFTLIIMIPIYISYIINVDVSFIFHLMFFISLIFIPIIPTIIGSLLGTILASLTSKFKRKNLFNIIFGLLFVLIVYYFSYQIQEASSVDLANLSMSIVNKFTSVYIIAKVYLNILKDYSLLNLFIFILSSVFFYQIFKYSLVKVFDNINSKLNENILTTKYREKDLKTRSRNKSLYIKEIKGYFSSSLYVLNTIIGCVLLIVMLLLVAIFGSDKVGEILQITEFKESLTMYTPMIFALFCSLSCTTNSSISLEGKKISILKSLPLKEKEIFRAKILVNLTILIPTIIIGSILVSFIFKFTIINYLVLLFTSLMYALFISLAGLLINLLFPNMDWKSEVKVIKQSASVFVSMIVGFTVSLIPFAIKVSINQTLYSFIIGLIMLLFTIIIYIILNKKGKILFNKI